MAWRRAKKRCEDPRNTLVRYAIAIDTQFDPDTASAKQETDLTTLIRAMRSAKLAQEHNLSKIVISARIGIALGRCERYMKLYHITPPDAPSV